MLLKIASQPVSGESTYSTGADVSRFQRSSVPGKAESGAQSMADAAGGIPVGKAVITGPVGRVARGTRSDERRGGYVGVSTHRYLWPTEHQIQKYITTTIN